jgi:hypothetical protein
MIWGLKSVLLTKKQASYFQVPDGTQIKNAGYKSGFFNPAPLGPRTP